jgi:hypothetical protein
MPVASICVRRYLISSSYCGQEDGKYQQVACEHRREGNRSWKWARVHVECVRACTVHAMSGLTRTRVLMAWCCFWISSSVALMTVISCSCTSTATTEGRSSIFRYC